MATSAEFLKQTVTARDLERELTDAGLLEFWYVSQPERDFDDLPTVGELLAWIERHRGK